MILRRGLAVLACFLLAGCDDDSTGPGNIGTESDEWSGVIAAGDRVDINGVSGSVLASISSGNEVVVRWTKRGPQSNLSRVDIEVVPDADGVTITAVYPAGNTNVDVTFTAEVPAGVEFVGRTVSGNVEADGLQSDAFGFTVSGDVIISTTQLAEANVISGDIDVAIGQADWSRDLDFTVQSGTLTVEVPSNTNAEVEATVTSGTITSDFPLQGTPTNQQGTLGSGGPTLTLFVSSGAIFLRSGPPG